jgi:DNA-binding GntR family transcriptional regulator
LGGYELIPTLDLPVQSPDQAVPRESLTKRVANKLKEGIISGDYALGQRLVEAELETRFGVSSSVIREALYTLQGEGLVVADAYRGRSVYSLDEEEAPELVVLRTSQESLAAFLAAEKLNEEWAERIAESAALIKSARPASFVEWVGLELGFHRTVWQAARIDWLCRQLSQLSIRMLSISALQYFCSGKDLANTLKVAVELEQTNNAQSHQLVAQSILSRDPRAARRSMILHVMGAECFAERRKQVFEF